MTHGWVDQICLQKLNKNVYGIINNTGYKQNCSALRLRHRHPFPGASRRNSRTGAPILDHVGGLPQNRNPISLFFKTLDPSLEVTMFACVIICDPIVKK